MLAKNDDSARFADLEAKLEARMAALEARAKLAEGRIDNAEAVSANLNAKIDRVARSLTTACNARLDAFERVLGLVGVWLENVRRRAIDISHHRSADRNVHDLCYAMAREIEEDVTCTPDRASLLRQRPVPGPLAYATPDGGPPVLTVAQLQAQRRAAVEMQVHPDHFLADPRA